MLVVGTQLTDVQNNKHKVSKSFKILLNFNYVVLRSKFFKLLVLAPS